MATLLLATLSKETRGKDLRRTLLHLLHGIHAIEHALMSFVIPFASRESILSTEGHPDILATFDAHVGDTACHMRAQMIWEVYEYYRPSERRNWINLALVALTQVKVQTIDLMISLYKKNGYMRALGFGSIVTYGQIFDAIGWSSFLDILGKKYALQTSGGVGISGSESPSSGITTGMPVTPEDREPVIPFLKSDYLGIIHMDAMPTMRRMPSVDSVRSLRSSFTDVSSLDVSAAPSTSGASAPSSQDISGSSSHSYRNVTTDATWDITNHLTIVRFLTLCRLLSVGKRAKVQAGFPNAAIRARTDPEFIYEQAEREIETFYSSAESEVEWKRLISSEDRAKRSFLVKEEEAVQVWLSSLTANWSVNLATEMGLSQSMRRFLKKSIVVSPRQISCVGSHPSIVPIRAEWLLRGTPILMLIRRFCSQGYHSSFYRVMANRCAWGSHPPIKNDRAVGLGKASWFAIEPVTIEEVQTASWTTTPHFVLISNSIDGTDGEFYDRVAGEGYGESGSPWPHESAHCAEHEEYLPRVLESNFARIVMSFFGQHDQYPFEMESSESGHEYVGGKMEAEGFGKKAMESYWRTVEEVEESGTGERPWMYTLEHAYTELPFVVGRQVQDVMEKKLQPVPIGYRYMD